MDSLSITDITILYGSQTGNAEDMAKRIGRKAKYLGYRILVEAIDDFPLKMLPKQNLSIFVCSTTGHGQEPENMKNFYNFIRRRDLPNDCLSSLKFAVYGLGDSSYAKFNYVSKILFKRLVGCGAKPIQELVLGDEQHELGCDGIIYPKLDELWQKLEDISCLSKIGDSLAIVENDDSDLMPANSYEAALLTDCDLSPEHPRDEFRRDFIERYKMKTAYCTLNQRLTPDTHFQDTRHLAFRSDEDIKYEPGDVCVILPANSDTNVKQFIETLNLNPNQRFSLTKKDANYMVNYLYDFIPDGLRIIDLVKYYLDIQSVPKRSFFEYLWPFSDNELERNKLKEFASTEGQEEMYEYCVQPKRNILEVLLDFPQTVKNIKFEYIFDLIPPIKPRSFSIASSLSAHPHEIHLLVGVVEYRTRMRQPRKGLCSNYLAQIAPVDSIDSNQTSLNSRLRFFIARTSFKLPKDDSTPIIMVGPGLGLAPFRSFIEDRSSRKDRASGQETTGYNHLFFGCRYHKADFYFEGELLQYVKEDALEMRVAYSREGSKEYVQDLMKGESELIYTLIMKKGAILYVAGNSKLPEDIRKVLIKILDQNREYSDESEKLVTQLESQNKIQYDCW